MNVYVFIFKITDEQRESIDASVPKDRIQSQKEPATVEKVAADEHLGGDKTSPNESNSDAPKDRPFSPGTLALLCDEQDSVFTTSASNGFGPDGADAPSQLPNGQVVTETYAAQEKVVLTAFRDCLNRLITFGELKGEFLLLPFRGEKQGGSVARLTFFVHADYYL